MYAILAQCPRLASSGCSGYKLLSMSAQNNDDEKRRERELQDLELRGSHFAAKDRRCRQAIFSGHQLFILGNSGGALATLGFIGTIAKDGTFPKVLLYPLFFFLFGLLLMGIGILVALRRERGAIIRNQRMYKCIGIHSRGTCRRCSVSG